jgi:hypothetical protein
VFKRSLQTCLSFLKQNSGCEWLNICIKGKTMIKFADNISKSYCQNLNSTQDSSLLQRFAST